MQLLFRRRTMKRGVCVAVVSAAITASTVLAATSVAQPAGYGAVTATISGIVPVPVGPLIDNRNVGIGGVAAVRVAPGPSSAFAIRLDISGLLPSSHNNGLPNATPHITNGSSALFGTVGPEFDLPAMSGHFYTTAAAGVAHIWASSSASNQWTTPWFGPYYTLTSRQTTNFAWGGSGGFVTPRSRLGFAGEVAVRYYDLGRATYTTLYPSVEVGPYNTPTKAFTTTGHHETTFVAPSIGLSWTP